MGSKGNPDCCLGPGAIPALLAELAGLQARLLLRFNAGGARTRKQDPERLLTVEEAAELLCTNKDWLYRHHDEFPFTVHLSEQQLRFSARGIAKFIRSIALWTPASRFMPDRIEYVERGGDTVSITLEQIETDAPLNDATFVIDLPEHVEITEPLDEIE